MKEQDTLNKETGKHPHPNPRFRSLLAKIFKQIGKGKGDYSVDRHKQPMPDIDTILEEAKKLEKSE